MPRFLTLALTLALAATAWAQVPELVHDEGTWRVVRVTEPYGGKSCYMRSAIHTIDKFGRAEFGYTFLEVDGRSHDVRFTGDHMGLYFRNTRSALQVDFGEFFPVAYQVPKHDSHLVDLMKAGNTAVVTVRDDVTDQAFAHTFSLHGFTRGLAALDHCTASLPSP